MFRSWFRRACGCEHTVVELEARYAAMEERIVDLLRKMSAAHAREVRAGRRASDSDVQEEGQEGAWGQNGAPGGFDPANEDHVRQLARQRGLLR